MCLNPDFRGFTDFGARKSVILSGIFTPNSTMSEKYAGLGKGARSMMVSDYEKNVPVFVTFRINEVASRLPIGIDEKTTESLIKQISPLPPRKIVNSESEWSVLEGSHGQSFSKQRH